MAAYEVLLLNTAIPQIQAAQSGDTYVVPRAIAFNAGVNVVNNDVTIYGVTVGRGAGAVATNTAVGASALAANTTGNGATAVGASALAGVNISAYATAVGYNALNANTSGEANAGFGAYSLFKTTSGAYNTGAGVGALQNNITGANNTAVGYTALINNTASSNTAVGHQAGYSNETGTYLTLVGYQAGFSNTVNSPQTSIGYQAGYFQTGTVVALGYRAAYGASGTSTGNFNTAIGDLALQANTTASNNTAVGYQAAYSNTTGAANIAIGLQAMYGATVTGNANIAIGASDGTFNPPMRYLSSGTFNVGVGNGTLAATGSAFLTGSYNTALGHAALYVNSSGTHNTAVGYQAGYANATGTGNTFVGMNAGAEHASGNRNLTIGPRNNAGNGAGQFLYTGSDNVYVGGYDGYYGGVLDLRYDSGYLALSDGYGRPLIITKTGQTVALESAVTSATGTGITFPATQSASSNANTLDDYEEGTHTTTVSCGTSGTVTLKTAENSLQYTKIGRQVTVVGLVTVDSVSSPVGYFTMSLPFPIGNHGEYSSRPSGAVTMSGVASANISDFVVLGVEGEGSLRIYLGDGTGIQPDAAEQLQANTSVYITFTYFI